MSTFFGTPKAARFGRTVRQEIRLMEQEESEDADEVNSFWDYEGGSDYWNIQDDPEDLSRVVTSRNDYDYDNYYDYHV